MQEDQTYQMPGKSEGCVPTGMGGPTAGPSGIAQLDALAAQSHAGQPHWLASSERAVLASRQLGTATY